MCHYSSDSGTFPIIDDDEPCHSERLALEQAQLALTQIERMTDIPSNLKISFDAIAAEDPRETLVLYCEAHKFDLLVVGSRKLTRMQQILLGSTSKYCLHHAPCSVLIYKYQ